jgi:hypothetical protein
MRSEISAASFLMILAVLVLGSFAAEAKPAETPALSLPRRPHYVFQRIGENIGLGSLTPSTSIT